MPSSVAAKTISSGLMSPATISGVAFASPMKIGTSSRYMNIPLALALSSTFVSIKPSSWKTMPDSSVITNGWTDAHDGTSPLNHFAA